LPATVALVKQGANRQGLIRHLGLTSGDCSSRIVLGRSPPAQSGFTLPRQGDRSGCGAGGVNMRQRGLPECMTIIVKSLYFASANDSESRPSSR
jgi:hypothetical protein